MTELKLEKDFDNLASSSCFYFSPSQFLNLKFEFSYSVTFSSSINIIMRKRRTLLSYIMCEHIIYSPKKICKVSGIISDLLIRTTGLREFI